MQMWLLDHATAEAKDKGTDQLSWVFGLHWPTSKPSAKVTLDDRAITFTGAWPPIEELLAFEPWNKESKRALLNVDAPRYMELERRYLAALDTLLAARKILDDVSSFSNTNPKEAARLVDDIDHHVKMAEAKHAVALETHAVTGETRLRQLSPAAD